MRRSVTAPYLVVLMTALIAVGCRAETPTPALRDQFRALVVSGRTPTPLNPQPMSTSAPGNVQVEKVRITPEAGQDAVVAMYRPKAEAKYPTIIFQHYLGATKDDVALTFLMMQLAQKGYFVAAIDGRYRGDRQNGTTLQAAMLQALKTGKGHPWLLDTVYDITRLIDYLQTRPDVDPNRIGMTGLSEGGVITWMSAVVDDRIKVAAPIIGVTSFAEAFPENGDVVPEKARLFEPLLTEYAHDLGEPGVNGRVIRTAWDKLVPGTLDKFDAPNLLPYVAPRPLLIISHESDELFPVSGAKKAYAAARARYKELNATDRIELQVNPGKHAEFRNLSEFTTLAAWMDRWLKQPPAQ